MKAIQLNRTVSASTLTSLSRNAQELYERTCLFNQAPLRTRSLRRLIESHTSDEGNVMDIAISATGLQRYQVDQLLKDYTSRVDNTREHFQHDDLISISDPRLVSGKPLASSNIATLAVVFRIHFSNRMYESADSRKKALNLLSSLSGMMDFTEKFGPSLASLYSGVPSLYQYRDLPCSILPDKELWTVAGSDNLMEAYGVLEWCYSKEDAMELISKMKQDGQRFDVCAVPFIDGFIQQAA